MADKSTLKCPNCGANIGDQSYCPYCGDREDINDYSSQLETTKLKCEIRELQSEIDCQQKEIDKLNKVHSSNGCMILGVGLVICVALIIAVGIMIFRHGDGIQYIFISTIIALPIIIIVSRYCDKNGNEEYQQKIRHHKREIKKLNEEILALNKKINE